MLTALHTRPPPVLTAPLSPSQDKLKRAPSTKQRCSPGPPPVWGGGTRGVGESWRAQERRPPVVGCSSDPTLSQPLALICPSPHAAQAPPPLQPQISILQVSLRVSDLRRVSRENVLRGPGAPGRQTDRQQLLSGPTVYMGNTRSYGGAWVIQMVKHLPSAQILIPGS